MKKRNIYFVSLRNMKKTWIQQYLKMKTLSENVIIALKKTAPYATFYMVVLEEF